MGLFSRTNRTKKATPPSVGLYGKTPAAGDFLRLNASGSEMRALDDWLARAVASAERLSPDWEQWYADAAQISFLFHGENSQRCLLGRLAPSRDASGRRFPLVLFAEVACEPLIDAYGCIPYHRFFSDARSLLQRSATLDRDALFSAVSRIEVPDADELAEAAREHGRYLDETSCGATFGPMFSNAEQMAAAFSTLRQLCRSTSSGLPRYGMRCPLARGGHRDAAVWLELQRDTTPVRVLPNILWSDRCLLSYFRQAHSKALLAAWRPEWQDETVCDLLVGEASEPAGVDPNKPLRSLFT